MAGVPLGPPVEPGGHHSLGRGHSACFCPGGGGTAVAVGKGRGLPVAACGKASALGNSAKAARGVEASTALPLLFSMCGCPGAKAKRPLPPSEQGSGRRQALPAHIFKPSFCGLEISMHDPGLSG